MTVERIEIKIRDEQTARDEIKNEISALQQDHRRKLLRAGNIDAIEQLDVKIRRLGISVEIAEARIQSLNGDLYLARGERQRWSNVASTGFVMPDREELARLMEIVRETEPDLAFDDDGFKRAFWATGQMWRAAALDKSRCFVSYVDDASELLRMRRQSEVSGSAFLGAIIGHGDIGWQRGDPALGVVMSVALDKNHGRPCSNRWRDILSGAANLLPPLPPRGMRASSSVYPTRGVTIRYPNGADADQISRY